MAHAFGIKLIYTKWESISCQSQRCLLEIIVLYFLPVFWAYTPGILSWTAAGRALQAACCASPLCRSGSVPIQKQIWLRFYTVLSPMHIRRISALKQMQQTIYSLSVFVYFFSVSNERKSLMWLIANYANLWSLSIVGNRNFLSATSFSKIKENLYKEQEHSIQEKISVFKRKKVKSMTGYAKWTSNILSLEYL